MKLTNAERLMLVMLADIQEKLEIDNGVDSQLLKNAIYSDNTWALSWELTGLALEEENDTPEEVREVCDILDMWEFLETAYQSFDVDEKAKIKVEADPFGDRVNFIGFDGNEEYKYLNIAGFLIRDMDRFVYFAKRDLNSHCPLVPGYLRMLEVFKNEIRGNLNGKMTVDEVIQVLKARIH